MVRAKQTDIKLMSPLLPLSTSPQSRKSLKPMMERKRRARMNACLDEIKSYLQTRNDFKEKIHERTEKADILDMTVQYLHQIRAHDSEAKTTPDDNIEPSVGDYRDGFLRCISDVTSFVFNSTEINTNAKIGLLHHLKGCLSVIDTPVFNTSHKLLASPTGSISSVSHSPRSSTSTLSPFSVLSTVSPPPRSPSFDKSSHQLKLLNVQTAFPFTQQLVPQKKLSPETSSRNYCNSVPIWRPYL